MTTASARLSADTLIKTYWRETAGVLLGYDCIYSEDPVYVETALASVHPELPALVRTMADWNIQHGGDGTVAGVNISCMLQHLTQTPVRLPSQNKHSDLYAWRIMDLQRSRLPDYMLMMTTTYCLRDIDGSSFVCDVKLIPWPQEVPTSWMDTQFPGWRARFEVAETIGCRGEELVALVCTQALPVVASVTLPSVTFD